MVALKHRNMTTATQLSRDEYIDLLVDILQVSLHQILRAKKLYPTGIFTEAQKFNTLVYKSVHPEINAYIDNNLKTVQSLLNEDLLEKFVLVIKKNKPVEKYVFCFNLYPKSKFSEKASLDLAEIYQQARTLWLTIGYRFSSQTQPDVDYTYTFEIHTKSAGYESILNKQSTVESLQWVQADPIGNPTGVEPVRRLKCQPFSVEVYREDFEEHSG